MNHKVLVLACVAVLSIAACKREEPVPPPQAAEPVAAPSVQPAPAEAMPAPAESFDTRGFAGTFSGGSTRLELKPDGTYLVHDGDAQMDGTWTVEAGNSRLRLDPNTKAQDDRLFAIVGRDQLDAVTADGQPATGDNAVSLKRGMQ